MKSAQTIILLFEYGWSPKGYRSYAEQDGFKTQRLSIVAGYNHGTNMILSPFEYEGYSNLNLFIQCFSQMLGPNLGPGNIVVMDNASFHKSDELMKIAEQFGIQVLYLAAYSPDLNPIDLNPIEKVWANFKRNLRKIIKKLSHLKMQ
jgi:isfu1 transposase